MSPFDRPIAFERVKDDKGDNFVVQWPKPVAFTGGERRSTMCFNVGTLGEDEARRQAREYFADVFADATLELSPFMGGVPRSCGPVRSPDERGLVYHGRERREFMVYGFPPVKTKKWPVVAWGSRADAFLAIEEICGNCEVVSNLDNGVKYV